MGSGREHCYDGWRFQVPLDLPGPEHANVTFLEEGLQNMLKAARSGIDLHRLMQVRFNIKPIGSEIKEVVYPSSHGTELRPGECATAYANVIVPELDITRSDGSDSSDELMEELFTMLGKNKTELLTAEVTYTHPLFPASTRLVTTTNVCVQRKDPSSAWAGGNDQIPRQVKTRGQDSADHRGYQAVHLIDYSRAMFIARTWPPDVALERLKRKFSRGMLERDHGSRIWVVTEELRFQSRISRIIKERSMQTNVGVVPWHSITTRGAGTSNEYRTEPGLGSEEAGKHDNTQTEKADDTPPVTQDKAHQIWRHMRTSSRSNSASHLLHNYNLEATNTTNSKNSVHPDATTPPSPLYNNKDDDDDETIQPRHLEVDHKDLADLRRQALRNKRSLGADTLRELGLDGRNSTSGAGFPWM